MPKINDYDTDNQSQNINDDSYSKGHLVDEKLGGLGKDDSLAPISKEKIPTEDLAEKEAMRNDPKFQEELTKMLPTDGKKDVAQLQKEDPENLSQMITQWQKDSPKVDPSKGELKTGLPEPLKSGIESLSGYDMSDVVVHYNSSKPAQLNALAYAKGTDIHVASGQEKHLPHEAWHVVQQKQGRVKPTLQMKDENVNDNSALEQEATAMGDKAMKTKPDEKAKTKAKPKGDGTTQLYKKDFDSPSIGTEQELNNVVIQKKLVATNRVGIVKKDGQDLLDVTSDMKKSNVDQETGAYTLEIISHPTEISDDASLQERNNAFVGLISKIEAAAKKDEALTNSSVGGGANLTILNSDHSVHPASEYSSGTVMGSGNQATVGVSIESIGTGDNGGEMIESAPWYDPSFKTDIVDNQDGYTYADHTKAKNVYAYVMSVLKKFTELTKKHKLSVGDLFEEGGYDSYTGNLTEPAVKNDWGMLPRSSAWAALDILDANDKAKIKEKIRTAQHGDDATISKHCFQYIVSGQALAGHGNINDATVGGKQAGLFEYRNEANMPASLLKVFWKYGDTQAIKESDEESSARWIKSDSPDYMKWSEVRDGKWWFFNTKTRDLCYWSEGMETYSEEKPFDKW